MLPGKAASRGESGWPRNAASLRRGGICNRWVIPINNLPLKLRGVFQNIKWKIKRCSNDELRQKFVDMCAEQVKVLNLTIPDEELKWNETTNQYDFGEINWEEFKNVLAGNGPCNKERLAARISAHANGAWVREAAEAYAKKQQLKEKLLVQ